MKSKLSASYEIKDIGEMKLILRIHINRNKKTSNKTLSQYAYSEQILKCFHMTKCKLVFTLLLLGIMLINNDSFSLSEETKEIEDVSYHKALKSLM